MRQSEIESYPERSIAIIGAGGQLGSELCRQLGPLARPLTRREIDLHRCAAVRESVVKLRPKAVINAAAYTNVETAETERELCRAVNAEAVSALADACAELDCPLVQISTDFVFGGDLHRRTPYGEGDEPHPLNWYGECKLLGETRAREWERHYVIRTCGLYSVSASGPVRGRNFPDTMMLLAASRDELQVVDDQQCTPSFVPDVAAGVLELLRRAPFGTYHLTNRGDTTWCRFARHLLHAADFSTRVLAITSQEYPSAASRPGFSVLDCAKASSLGVSLPAWQTGVTTYVAGQARGTGCLASPRRPVSRGSAVAIYNS